MYGKGRKKGSVRIALQVHGSAKSVAVAGTFTDWKPVKLRKQKGGEYVVNLDVPPGTYEYKFVVDGDWQVDPDNSAWALNPYGTLNSLMTVE